MNGDGIFDVTDALYILQGLAGQRPLSALSNTDANGDGVTSVADVVFLARAAAGLVPFLDAVQTQPVSPDSDCLLQVMAQLTFPPNGPSPNRTTAFFLLSYPERADFISLSVTSDQPGRQLDNTSTVFRTSLDAAAVASNNSGGGGGGTYNFRLSLYTPIDRQLDGIGVTVLVVSSDDNQRSSAERVATFQRTRSSVFVGDSQLVPQIENLQLSELAEGTSLSVGDSNGFSPFTVFNNSVRSDYCALNGSVVILELPENTLPGEVVYNISAFDSLFPSTNELFTSSDSLPQFNVTPSGGVVLEEGLDLERRSMYAFSVSVSSLTAGYEIGTDRKSVV